MEPALPLHNRPAVSMLWQLRRVISFSRTLSSSSRTTFSTSALNNAVAALTWFSDCAGFMKQKRAGVISHYATRVLQQKPKRD